MPLDRDGKYWKPECGVERCFGRGCYGYSLYAEKCRLVIDKETWERIQLMKRGLHRKTATLAAIADTGPSLSAKTPLMLSVAVAHAGLAKSTFLADLIDYDGESAR